MPVAGPSEEQRLREVESIRKDMEDLAKRLRALIFAHPPLDLLSYIYGTHRYLGGLRLVERSATPQSRQTWQMSAVRCPWPSRKHLSQAVDGASAQWWWLQLLELVKVRVRMFQVRFVALRARSNE